MLFAPITLRSLEIRNRLWVAPMCQYSVWGEDGVPGDWHLAHYGALSAGGPGMIIAEATGVVPEGRISAKCTGLWSDEQIPAWRRIANLVHEQGARFAVQLNHAGRKGFSSPEVSPSTMPSRQVRRVVENFAASAVRAVESGFDAVELHGAHGYLLHQFLSPLSNEREDEYGGTLEGRARFLTEAVAAVRVAVGEDVPVLVRLSATDWLDGGVTPESTADVARWCAQAGADFFDVSTAGLLPAEIPLGPGYQVPFARYVRDNAHVPVGAVGLITQARQAESILEEGAADVVLMAREWLRDPHSGLRFARELGVDIDYWPQQYLRAR